MERKITKLNKINSNNSLGESLNISKLRFEEISEKVYFTVKEMRSKKTTKSNVIQAIIDKLDGVTPEELLILGMSFGALEHMNSLAKKDISTVNPEEIANGGLNVDAFESVMKNGEHDF